MVAVVNASIAAREELANTPPTTLAGMGAYLDFVLLASEKMDDMLFSDGDESIDFVRSLASATKRIASRA
jgi:hypothetical protein